MGFLLALGGEFKSSWNVQHVPGRFVMPHLRLVALICLLATSAAASPLPPPITCAQFSRNLADAIQAGGGKVAFPTDFSVAFQERGNPFVRYRFTGIEGLRGSLNCLKNDEYRNVYMEAALDSRSADENEHRLDRAKALVSAAVCATEHWSPDECAKAVSSVFQKSYDAFLAAMRHREASPRGEFRQYFPTGAQIDVSAIQNSFLILVHSPRPKD
jgi:hypothetical protein